MTFLRKTHLPTSLLVGTIAIVALGVSAFQIVGALTTQTPSPSGDLLLDSSRSRLEICVQNVDSFGGFDSALAIRQVEEALTDVKNHPKWPESGYSKGGGPKVDGAQCASEPYYLRPGVEFVDGVLVSEMNLPTVNEASPYRLFVFVVSETTRNAVIKGSLDVRRAPQEVFCEVSTCATITTGIYVTEAELANRSFLAKTLVEGLELVPPRAQVPDRSDTKLEGPVRNPQAP